MDKLNSSLKSGIKVGGIACAFLAVNLICGVVGSFLIYHKLLGITEIKHWYEGEAFHNNLPFAFLGTFVVFGISGASLKFHFLTDSSENDNSWFFAHVISIALIFFITGGVFFSFGNEPIQDTPMQSIGSLIFFGAAIAYFVPFGAKKILINIDPLFEKEKIEVPDMRESGEMDADYTSFLDNSFEKWKSGESEYDRDLLQKTANNWGKEQFHKKALDAISIMKAFWEDGVPLDGEYLLNWIKVETASVITNKRFFAVDEMDEVKHSVVFDDVQDWQAKGIVKFSLIFTLKSGKIIKIRNLNNQWRDQLEKLLRDVINSTE